MKKKLSVANIGMKFGMSHIEGAMSYGAEIAAICDTNEENLRFAGERYGIPEEKWVTDYMDIVNNKDIDVVTVFVSLGLCGLVFSVVFAGFSLRKIIQLKREKQEYLKNS